MAQINKAKIEMEIEYRGKTRDLEKELWILFQPKSYRWCGQLVKNYKVKTLESKTTKIPPKPNPRRKKLNFYKKVAKKILGEAGIEVKLRRHRPKAGHQITQTPQFDVDLPIKDFEKLANFLPDAKIATIPYTASFRGEYSTFPDRPRSNKLQEEYWPFRMVCKIYGAAYVDFAKQGHETRARIPLDPIEIHIGFNEYRFCIIRDGKFSEYLVKQGDLHNPESIQTAGQQIRENLWRSTGKFGDLLLQYSTGTTWKSTESKDAEEDFVRNTSTGVNSTCSTSNPVNSKFSSGKNMASSMLPDYDLEKLLQSLPVSTTNSKSSKIALPSKSIGSI